jgi:hypothetical protein
LKLKRAYRFNRNDRSSLDQTETEGVCSKYFETYLSGLDP